jgi:glycerol-3-phosphate dehydrogenase (NAD(P)+)
VAEKVQGKQEQVCIAILGAGSWGLTLARILSLAGKNVRVWSHNAKKAEALQAARRLDEPISIEIPESVVVTGDLAKCLDGCQVVLFCCTAQTMRELAKKVASHLKVKVAAAPSSRWLPEAGPVLVSAAKGIELKTFMRMTEILNEAIPGLPACALSGPNLAAEVLNGQPAASVIACQDESVARYVQEQLTIPAFRLYTNTDVAGVELGGALKNIIAIAGGVVDGLFLGTNAKAALMSRGLAEMTRMAVALGAKATTLSGLAGVGDLIATSDSIHSRNFRLGYEVARGSSPAKAEVNLGAVAEGVTTTDAVCELAAKMKISVPIAEQVQAILKGKTTPREAIMTLMSRPLASE